jgi:tryptophanyl-tRNA synthetase
MGTILSGIQPSGNLTLGNYLGAIKNWVSLQNDYECFFCIVDLHSLIISQDPEKLKHYTREVAAVYIASGIDPEGASIFVQSAVPAHTELGWILGCYTPLGWLNRMIQFKDKAGKNKEFANLGLYAYPVLQAADILLYQATHVPVGEDQKQHVELTRDIALSFNHFYKKDVFTIPEPLIFGHGTRVMSLRDGTKKMSKSDPSDYSRLNMLDDADTIALKIQKAKTDPEPLPGSPKDLEQRPEALNLVSIYAALAGLSPEDVCQQFAGAPFSKFKPILTDLVISVMNPISQRVRHLMNDFSYLDKVLGKGRDHAAQRAQETFNQVKETIGLLNS